MKFKYTFIGIVLPERAQMSLSFNHDITLGDGASGHINCSVINNQLLAVMTIDSEMDVLSLRNLTHLMIQNHFSAVGFYTGHYYDVRIERVYNDDLSLNYVYGIENRDIKDFWGEIDLLDLMNQYTHKASGQQGIFINRCLGDLMNALKNVEDAAFFCYRAIETLRNHNSLRENLINVSETRQWESFRNNAHCERAEIEFAKKYADDLRHGRPVALSGEEIREVLINTWSVVRKYYEII